MTTVDKWVIVGAVAGVAAFLWSLVPQINPVAVKVIPNAPTSGPPTSPRDPPQALVPPAVVPNQVETPRAEIEQSRKDHRSTPDASDKPKPSSRLADTFLNFAFEIP